MVKEIKRKSLSSKIRAVALSPFILPILTFAFVLLTLPVILLMSQTEQDIRQQAASIATNSVAINTEDISYEKAYSEVVTTNTMTFSGLAIGLIVIGTLAIIIVFYRRKVSY